MKIKRISIRNFLSFQSVDLDLSKYSGITVIKGKNNDSNGSNGSGKSALVEAIYFGLTGKTIRKTNEAALVNAQFGSKCCVSLEIEHDGQDINIFRGRKPTLLRTWVNGEETTTDHARNTQDYIDKLLNTNARVLLASMFFGQSNDTNFLDATPDEKRTIIKNFLNLDDIFEMREGIRGYKAEYSSRAKFYEKLISKNESNIAEAIINQGTAEEVMDPPEMTMEECNEQWAVWNAYEKRKEGCEDQVEAMDKEIESLETNLFCKTCHKPLYSETKDSLIADCEKEKELAQSEHDKLVLSPVYAPPVTIRMLAKSIDHQILAGQQKVYADSVRKLTEENEEYNRKIQENRNGYEVMRFWEKALSESGVIKYIIRNILTYFNSKCNYYLGYLTDSMYSIKFDDELTEKIFIKEQEIPYISLSGGEKRKINLAVMMALKDLLLFTDKNHSNILFLDEIAENIDESGVTGLYNLLLELKSTRDIFVITHNKHLKNMLESSARLTVVKNNGISTVWQSQN